MAENRTERERFGLGEDGALIHYEHAHRYLLAAELARERRVLDLACGSGYGSRVLRQAGLDVTALDLDRGCARDASPAVCARGEALPFADGSFECIVCFETIEHVSEPERIVAEISRVLAPDGIALISTPNRTLYSERSKRINPYHLRELDRAELDAMLGRHFRASKLFAQSVWAGSWIAPENPTAAQASTLRTLELPEELAPPASPPAPWAPQRDEAASGARLQPAPLYFLAICAHSSKAVTKLGKIANAANLLHDSSQRLIGEMLGAQLAATDRGAEVESQERHSRQIEHDLESARERIAALEENDRNLVADLEREREEHRLLREHLEHADSESKRIALHAEALASHVRNVEGLLEQERERAAGVGEHAGNLERSAREDAERIRELEAHASNLERIHEERAERISELEAHASNLDTISDERSERIRELEAHAINLESVAAQHASHAESLEEHARNLEQARSLAGVRADELERHAANLELRDAERAERIAGLEAHSENLERLRAEGDEHVASLETRAANLEAALSEETTRAAALTRSVEELDARAGELGARTSELEAALAEGEQTARSLEAERNHFEAARNATAAERDGLRQQISSLQGTLGFRILRRLGLIRDAVESVPRKDTDEGDEAS